MPVATLAIELLIAIINNAAAVSAVIANAKAQNRDVTLAELQTIIDGDAVARANLVLAIAAAKAAGK